MKKKTITKLKNSESLLEVLMAYGYDIEKKQPWHWRITKQDYNQKVDVWATKRKWWVVGSNSAACLYSCDEDLIIKLKNIFIC